MEIHQRDCNVIIETLRRNHFKAADIHAIISAAWGENTMSLRRVQEIVKEFKDGHRISFDRAAGSGTLQSEARFSLQGKILDAVTIDPHLSSRALAAMFDTNHVMVQTVLKEDLQMRSVNDRRVPYNLSEANKAHRVECCRNMTKFLCKRDI